MIADASTTLVLLLVAVIACMAVFALAFIVIAICNLALIGIRELAHRRYRRRRSSSRGRA